MIKENSEKYGRAWDVAKETMSCINKIMYSKISDEISESEERIINLYNKGKEGKEGVEKAFAAKKLAINKNLNKNPQHTKQEEELSRIECKQVDRIASDIGIGKTNKRSYR